MRYLKSYSSAIITVLNTLIIFGLIRYINGEAAPQSAKLAELLFLSSIFPILTLGFPTLITAEVARNRFISRDTLVKSRQYLLFTSIITISLAYHIFDDTWWVCFTYPLIYTSILWRGYFEGSERFWAGASIKLLASSMTLLSTLYISYHQNMLPIYVLLAVCMTIYFQYLLKRNSQKTITTHKDISKYTLQAMTVLSMLFVDKFVMRLTSNDIDYANFIITQEACFKIASMFLLITVFHFPQINSASNTERASGISAYKGQVSSAFVILTIFTATPLVTIFFSLLGFDSAEPKLLVFVALIFPVVSLTLQKVLLVSQSTGTIKLFLTLITCSNLVGILLTTYYQNPLISLGGRGIAEVAILATILYNNKVTKTSG